MSYKVKPYQPAVFFAEKDWPEFTTKKAARAEARAWRNEKFTFYNARAGQLKKRNIGRDTFEIVDRQNRLVFQSKIVQS